jgi:hypothetical protein
LFWKWKSVIIIVMLSYGRWMHSGGKKKEEDEVLYMLLDLSSSWLDTAENMLNFLIFIFFILTLFYFW